MQLPTDTHVHLRVCLLSQQEQPVHHLRGMCWNHVLTIFLLNPRYVVHILEMTWTSVCPSVCPSTKTCLEALSYNFQRSAFTLADIVVHDKIVCRYDFYHPLCSAHKLDTCFCIFRVICSPLSLCIFLY